MKKNLILLALATVGLASCNGGFKKAAHGVLYNINVDKSGPAIKLGDYVVMNLVLKNDADSVIVSSYDLGHPFAFPVTPQHPGDIFDVFPMLSEGDSANIKVTLDSMYKGQPKPPTLTGKYMNYSVKIEKVISKGSLSDQDFSQKVADYMKGTMEKYKSAEPGKIAKYLADSKINFTKTASGLQYIITKPGIGPTPSKGDTVFVNYTVKFTDGKVLETNVKDEDVKAKKYSPMKQYQPIPLPIGVGRVIPGWDEGMMLLNKGAKATFLLPSNLAYGEQGNRSVGPYTPLVFDIELVNFKKGDPNAPAPTPMMPGMVPPGQKPAAAPSPAAKKK